ncbi:hypothetical protein [Sphingomonas adhaesiva]|uniref:hypothetical protein n=1 Tax=Sphingomonas adhaesiva TaxID=28212 RepID=UPI002FFC33A2
MNNTSDYPRDHAGHRGIGGSIEAAQVITPARDALWQQIMKKLETAGAEGMTGDEIAASLGWEKYRVRPRTAELRKLGWIRDSQQRRPSESGIRSIVWVTREHAGPVKIGSADDA